MQQNPTGQMLNMLVMMGFVFFFLYFAVLRPQNKQKKEHEEMMKTLKAGDKVQTSGGILGVVLSVKDNAVSIRSADSKLEITKAAITAVLERSSSSPAS
jgi:preprotein translocase subunit YajC